MRDQRKTRADAPIEFWFDFASGYAYFAALEIEGVGQRHRRTVAWRPFTLGAAFKVTGAQGLVDGEPFWGSDRLPMVERWLERPW